MLLGEAVHQHAGNADGSSDPGLERDWVAEDDDGSDHDEDALQGVSDGEGDRVDVAEGQVHNLIVEVVEKSRGDNCARHLHGSGTILPTDGGSPKAKERLSLANQGDGDGN